MLKNILCVAAGGAVGSLVRYGISIVPLKTNFPVQTFVTNLIGALIIGFITTFAVIRTEQNGGRISTSLLLLLKTGFCGGFTTFSTFALETVTLFEKGRQPTGAIYAVLSLAAGFACVLLGEFLAELISD